MYDYMKALQKRFDRQSHPELDTQIEADGLYSFEREEEEHICHPAEQED